MKHHKALQHHPRASPNKHAMANNTGTDTHTHTHTRTRTHTHSHPQALCFFITASGLPFESWQGWEHSFSELLSSKHNAGASGKQATIHRGWEESRCSYENDSLRHRIDKAKPPPISHNGHHTQEWESSFPHNLPAISLHVFHYNLHPSISTFDGGSPSICWDREVIEKSPHWPSIRRIWICPRVPREWSKVIKAEIECHTLAAKWQYWYTGSWLYQYRHL